MNEPVFEKDDEVRIKFTDGSTTKNTFFIESSEYNKLNNTWFYHINDRNSSYLECDLEKVNAEVDSSVYCVCDEPDIVKRSIYQFQANDPNDTYKYCRKCKKERL